MEPKVSLKGMVAELATAIRISAALCAIGVVARCGGNSAHTATVIFDEFNFRVSNPRGKPGLWNLSDSAKRTMRSIDIFAPKKGIEEAELCNMLAKCEAWRAMNAEQIRRQTAIDETEALLQSNNRVSFSVQRGEYSGGIAKDGIIHLSVPTLDLPRMTAALLKLLNEQKAKDKHT